MAHMHEVPQKAHTQTQRAKDPVYGCVAHATRNADRSNGRNRARGDNNTSSKGLENTQATKQKDEGATCKAYASWVGREVLK